MEVIIKIYLKPLHQFGHTILMYQHILSDGTISFTVSGTDLNYNAYLGLDKIDFVIDQVPPTLSLTDNHPDLLLNLSDTVLVQASLVSQ